MDAAWNALHAEALAVIRKTNPTRNVIIGPAFWNNVGWLDKLELPDDGPAHHRDRALLPADDASRTRARAGRRST